MEQREFRMPATGEGWRHYKGSLYTVIGIGTTCDGDAGEGGVQVIYTPYRWSLIQLPPIFVRSIGDFLKHVHNGGDHPVPRFRFERERETDEICPFIHPVTGSGFRGDDQQRVETK